MHSSLLNSKPTVFLVEDDESLRRSLEWFLTSHGYWVRASASIADALASYAPQAHGCLVLDVNLPEGTGLDLLREFRERGGDHPFIVMTAYGRVPTAVEAMKLGAIDFLEKPFAHEALLLRVQEALAKDVSNREMTAEVEDLRERIGRLAQREWEIAKLIAQGRSSKEIAAHLGIKPKTVESHRRNLFLKLEVASAAEASAIVSAAQSLAKQSLMSLPE